MILIADSGLSLIHIFCHGVNLSNMSDEEIWKRGVDLSYIIDAYHNLNMGNHFFSSFFERLIGTDYVRKMIENGKSADEIDVYTRQL